MPEYTAAVKKKKNAEIIKLLTCLLLCCLWFLLLFSLGCFVCLFVVLLLLVASFSQQHVEGLASKCYSVESRYVGLCGHFGIFLVLRIDRSWIGEGVNLITRTCVSRVALMCS